jgi:hypothetical protein
MEVQKFRNKEQQQMYRTAGQFCGVQGGQHENESYRR